MLFRACARGGDPLYLPLGGRHFWSRIRSWCASTSRSRANNLTLEGDLTRRALLCELDAGVACPELRELLDGQG
jgi:hypothetical protein